MEMWLTIKEKDMKAGRNKVDRKEVVSRTRPHGKGFPMSSKEARELGLLPKKK